MEDYRAAIENLSLDQLTKNLRTLRESGVWKSLKPSERNALRKEYKAASMFYNDYLRYCDEEEGDFIKSKIKYLDELHPKLRCRRRALY